MPLRILVFAGLRVLAIYLVIEVVDLIPMLVSMIRLSGGNTAATGSILTEVGMIVTAVILWLLAGRLASGVAREYNPTIQFNFGLEDAYSIAFVTFGLYCVLQSLPGAVISLYRFMSALAQYAEADVMRSQSLVDLYRYGITLAAGLSALLGHRLWARKLIALDARLQK